MSCPELSQVCRSTSDTPFTFGFSAALRNNEQSNFVTLNVYATKVCLKFSDSELCAPPQSAEAPQDFDATKKLIQEFECECQEITTENPSLLNCLKLVFNATSRTGSNQSSWGEKSNF